MLNLDDHPSPIGSLLFLEEDGSLKGVWTEKAQETILASIAIRAKKRETPAISAAKRWLDDYFAGKRPTPDALPLRPDGTLFQKRVWKHLCRIPYGCVVTCKDISDAVSAEVGHPMAPQAVGQAVGRNPVSVIIPCHRVIGIDGSLTGYAGGLDRKVYLLRHEGLTVSEEGIVGDPGKRG